MEDPMTNDATTADGNSHPGMMGDGTEEQNLNQTGNPSARITEAEVQAAFGGGGGKTGTVAAEARSFKQKAKAVAADVKDKADDYYDEASDIVEDRMSAMTDRISAMRDQVQQSADAAREWAQRQAEAAKQTAQDKPMLVLSVGAGVAMAVGLMAGFVIGRATADDY
jgi:ElaB/YqjD/DUF883 family membrane-anchored ribosome-binding protein